LDWNPAERRLGLRRLAGRIGDLDVIPAIENFRPPELKEILGTHPRMRRDQRRPEQRIVDLL
jgi:hypothetical protein